jgi:hypothetical protein
MKKIHDKPYMLLGYEKEFEPHMSKVHDKFPYVEKELIRFKNENPWF